jgi:hypothetical protein
MLGDMLTVRHTFIFHKMGQIALLADELFAPQDAVSCFYFPSLSDNQKLFETFCSEPN